MFQNYLKVAFRNINKSKVFSAINLFGLAIGLAGCLIIFQYLMFEISYNKFHENSENIYRISYSKEKDGIESFNTVLTYSGVGPRLKENFPEVIDFARLRPASVITATSVITYGSDVYEENRTYFADASFLKIFSFEMIEGDPGAALKEQFTAVITQSTAKKYFGSENPIGKVFKQGVNDEYTITGVLKDTPLNSHVKFDFLLSHSTLSAIMHESWTEDNITSFHGHLYLLMNPQTDIRLFESKLPQFVDDFVGGIELKENGTLLKLWVMPLEDIHLYSKIEHESEINGDARTITYLSIIAILILSIAWVNYINLSTARVIERANEVGVRKVMGAQKNQLIKQFIFESSIINICAVTVAVGLVLIAQPLFAQLGASHMLEMNIFENQIFWIAILSLFVLGVIFSGTYPAFILSSFKPVDVMKGGRFKAGKGSTLRKVLVVFQFSASIALIIGTGVVFLQINYLRNQDLGVNIERSLVVRAPLLADSTYENQVHSFKSELLKSTVVNNVVASYDIPGREFNSATWYRKTNETDDNAQFCYRTFVDEDFIPAMGIKIIAGRGFESIDNNYSTILNETAVDLFQYPSPEEAIGNELTFMGSDGTYKLNIVGVIQNYHHLSPKLDHSPLIIGFTPTIRNYYIVQFNTGSNPGENISKAIATTESVYKSTFEGNPFNYFFLDDEFESQYKADKQFGDLFGFFGALALFVACLGLYGLSSYTVLRRTKEIGVKKVLGSSVLQILKSLSMDYLRLVLVANIISWPIIFYLMQNWLEGFASHIAIQWWLFPVAGLAVTTLALFTVSFHTVKAATTNPVKSLRYE